jgi:hypothetical protein
VASGAPPATFTATVKATGQPIDAASFSSFVGTGNAPAYQ